MSNSFNRRDFVTAGAVVAGGAALLARASTAEARKWDRSYSGGRVDVKPDRPGTPGKDYDPIVVPDGGVVPFTIVDGVKVFHLVVEEVEHEFAPGLTATCWGYNGRVNGTTLEAVEGERIRVYVTNTLKVPTTVHWHGIYLPAGMDGVSGLTQRPIMPGQTFRYEWTLRQHGTYMFHSHHDAMTQEGMGLMGMFVIHPRKRRAVDRVDRDFAMMLSEWRIDPGTSRPNTGEMSDFNVLTMNGRAFPGTSPLVVKTGERVRIRFGNLSAMDHHPIHLHGYHFKITATDGGQIPDSARWPETTVLVSVGQTRDIEFVADAPGDWLMHCHMSHHVMNQMGHGGPNMVGIDAGPVDTKVGPLIPGYMTMGQHGMSGMGKMGMPMPENTISMVGKDAPYGYIGMGGMFTLVKVRDELDSYDDPGWYEYPEGTMAIEATAAELSRDGIET